MMRKTTLLATALFLAFCGTAQFKEGYYYDKNNTPIKGLIKFHYGVTGFSKRSGDCYILFKESEEAKAKKLRPDDINGFVTGTDSFTIVKDFFIDASHSYSQDLAQVMESGKINLFIYHAESQRGPTTNLRTAKENIWLAEKNGKIRYITKGRFKKIFVENYIQDNPELVRKINNKELSYGDLQEIVRLYNSN